MNAHTTTSTAACEGMDGKSHGATAQEGGFLPALIEIMTLRDGRRLQVRPILPQDDRALADLINRLSDSARRGRFPNAREPVTADQLGRLTCIDYRRHMALVVTTLQGGRERLVAEARYLIDADGKGAEFTLVVDDAWQRRGVASQLLLALSRVALAAGVDWLRCDVMVDNAPMLALMRRWHFCCAVDRIDHRIVHVETRPRALIARNTLMPLRRRAPWMPRWLSRSAVATY